MLENNNYAEKKNVRKKLIMTIALVLITVALGIGGVYAYFAAAVSQDTTSNVSISAVSGLAISFSNSNTINIPDALPGQSWSKTFSATLTNNSANIEVEYSVIFHISTNTFDSNKGYLKYSLSGAEKVSERNLPTTETGEDVVLVDSKKITGDSTTNNVVDSYTLTIRYPNLDTVQEQGGVLNGYVYFTASSKKIHYEESSSELEKTYITESGIEKKASELAVGDIVKIGNEEFYVLPIDEQGNVIDADGNIHALAKYNLLVGNVVDASGDITSISTEREGYGLQSRYTAYPEEYIACDYYQEYNQAKLLSIEIKLNNYITDPIIPSVGEDDPGPEEEDKPTPFDPELGWVNPRDLAGNVGVSVFSYKSCDYDDNSIVKGYVEDYVDILNEYIENYSNEGMTITGRLITLEELELLGCSSSDYSCTSAPSWVYQTSYWSESPGLDGWVWYVLYTDELYACDWSNGDARGVRPVIEF